MHTHYPKTLAVTVGILAFIAFFATFKPNVDTLNQQSTTLLNAVR